MEFDEKLIQAVQNRDALYNMRHFNYRNNILRMQMWHDIAKEINSDINMCQKRWKSLRRKYAEECANKKLPSGSGTSLKKKPWPYSQLMQFLKPYVENKDTTTSCDPVEEREETSPQPVSYTELECTDGTGILSPTFSEEDVVITYTEDTLQDNSSSTSFSRSETPSRPSSNQSAIARSTVAQKRKRVENLIEAELSKPVNDDVQHFLLSLAPMLRQLDPIARLELQIDMQSLILKKIKEK